MEYFLSVIWEFVANNSFAVLVIITAIIGRMTRNRSQTVVSSVLLATLVYGIKYGVSLSVIPPVLIFFLVALAITYDYRTSG